MTAPDVGTIMPPSCRLLPGDVSAVIEPCCLGGRRRGHPFSGGVGQAAAAHRMAALHHSNYMKYVNDFDGGARFRGEPDRAGGGLRFVRAAIFQIGIDRQVGGLRNRPAIVEDHGKARIRAAERIGDAKAGGCQRLETHGGEQPRGARVPRVRDDKGARPLMQGAEGFGFFQLRAHRALHWLSAKK